MHEKGLIFALSLGVILITLSKLSMVSTNGNDYSGQSLLLSQVSLLFIKFKRISSLLSPWFPVFLILRFSSARLDEIRPRF